MKRFFRRLFKSLAYTAAALIILLAIAVGLFRLFLPRLPEYQEQIMAWASTAVGMQVQFSGMDARWGLRGPQLEFYDAELIRNSNATQLLKASEVSVGVSLLRLLKDRQFVVDRIGIRDTAIELRQREDGRWLIQGGPPDELINRPSTGAGALSNVEIIGEDIELRVLQPGDERPHFIEVSEVQLRRDDSRIAVQASASLPEQLGRDLNISATQLQTEPEAERSWDVTVEGDHFNLGELSLLLGDNATGFVSGVGELDLALVYAGQQVQSATANVQVRDASIDGDDAFDLQGRVEFHRQAQGWLLAADKLALQTLLGQWPEVSFRLEASVDENGAITAIDASTSYLNLLDLRLFEPWMPASFGEQFSRYAADGVIRDLSATIRDLQSEQPGYTVAAEFDNVGFSAVDDWPGVRGFSGRLNTDASGGRLDLQSQDMTIVSSAYFRQPITIHSADGTLIWRRSNNKTTILSDNIAIESPVVNAQSSVQVAIDGDAAPVVDLVSTFAVPDVALAKQYIPNGLLKPKLHKWFQTALQGGTIPRGQARLYGPLDKFPFDNDEGQLLIEANVRNASMRYHPDWPTARLQDVDVVVDNARLYSERGNSSSAGLQVVDAKVEIADLRKPLLTIVAQAAGPLENARQFAMQSPIDKILGGNLHRVQVSGDADYDVNLKIPLRAAKNVAVQTTLQTRNAELRIEGFPAAVSELSGTVAISRDDLSSDALTGVFLGKPVTIELRRAGDDEPEFAAIATANGAMTAQALVQELALPLEDILEGQTDYSVDVRFPRSNQEAPQPLTFDIRSTLVGMAIKLPAPLQKPAAAELPLHGDIRLLSGGERIESQGRSDNTLAWQLAVLRGDEGWDLDRGVLALGAPVSGTADTRGLHIEGRADWIRFQDWLDLSRRGDAQLNVVDRIRSIDMQVTNLHILGQHLVEHRVRVDRSARDWLVQVEGQSASGSVFVPYDFKGERAIVLDMERLYLPGDDEEPSKAADLPDPRSLPAITLKAEEFALGDRHFGRVETEVQRTADGLATNNIRGSDASFDFSAEARWVVDPADPSGQRTHITGSMTSRDVQATMRRLNYDPGIDGKEMSITMDLSWSGGPREEFLDSLDGEVQVHFGAGQLREVNPGAGRVFGLMSIAALPRRLSLDFSDVFDKGFGFDEIDGTFRIEDGDAYTCNLKLEGPAADIGIVGRAGLVARDYEQTAIVSADLGGTLPIVTAVVAGPQAAAAAFLFSQIFKKPLKEAAQQYYSIDGSWDDANPDSSNAAGFERSAELAGCLAETE